VSSPIYAYVKQRIKREEAGGSRERERIRDIFHIDHVKTGWKDDLLSYIDIL